MSKDTFSQGWEEITPTGLEVINNFESFDYQNGQFEIYVWNLNKGFKLNETLQWDSVMAYYDYLCNPIDNEYAKHWLIDVGRSYTNPNLLFSIFLRTGCIVEAYIYIFRDTTGQITNQNEIYFIDDFIGTGIYSSIKVSPFNYNHVYFTYADSLYYSLDKGQTFNRIAIPFLPLSDIFLSPLDSSLMFISGESNLYKSINNGQSWISILDVSVNQIEFDYFNEEIVYAVSDSGIFKSINKGDTWDNVFDSKPFFSIEIDKDSSWVLYAGSNNGELYQSLDGGIQWNIYNNTFTTLNINGIYKISNSDTLIISTENGVFKVYDSFVLGVNNYNDYVKSRFQLYQNFPNPFNEKTKITYKLDQSGYVRLKLYNIMGQEVESISNIYQQPGIHGINFDGSELPSGIYVYFLIINSNVQTKKMLLIK